MVCAKIVSRYFDKPRFNLDSRSIALCFSKSTFGMWTWTCTCLWQTGACYKFTLSTRALANIFRWVCFVRRWSSKLGANLDSTSTQDTLSSEMFAWICSVRRWYDDTWTNLDSTSTQDPLHFVFPRALLECGLGPTPVCDRQVHVTSPHSPPRL